MTKFRIHGDNIIECERIAKIITSAVHPTFLNRYLSSPSTIVIEVKFIVSNIEIKWELELLPGFNKNTKKRWCSNIFDALNEAGSYFDETPDVILSKIEDNDYEKILLGIEFCSALQAGNQAWQRSARAFSIGKTGCPYLYIVDFVKYELDNKTRKRKNLRFPNAAVPYSYISYSKNTGNFIAQLYTKSEEFNKEQDCNLKNFNEINFGTDDLATYITKLMLGLDTTCEEKIILNKNMEVVKFLSKKVNANKNFIPEEWQTIYELDRADIVDYAVKKNRFNFTKTVATKSRHGQSDKVCELIKQLSTGFASKDLPFGIIPAKKRILFANELSNIYPNADSTVMNLISSSSKHLIVAVFKGFKPRGDDNRPDRGVLPLISMLSNLDTDVFTYVYGPMIETNLKLLDTNPMKLSKKNGLWCSILTLSNFLLLDAPVISHPDYSAERLLDVSLIKDKYSKIGIGKSVIAQKVFSSTPLKFGEDDVDTGIHYLFNYLLGKYCFEGLCNPPGGDWSGFSIVDGEYEKRWLSLPRVSDVVEGKRPDHIIQFFNVSQKPLLLAIESKEKSSDLEPDVGIKLVTYINKITASVPSTKRKIYPSTEKWEWGKSHVNINSYEVISAAAYLKIYAEEPDQVFKKQCELIFVMNPVVTDKKSRWEIEIIPSTERSQLLKDYIIKLYNATYDTQFNII